jgi:hypothetical protein
MQERISEMDIFVDPLGGMGWDSFPEMVRWRGMLGISRGLSIHT